MFFLNIHYSNVIKDNILIATVHDQIFWSDYFVRKYQKKTNAVLIRYIFISICTSLNIFSEIKSYATLS